MPKSAALQDLKKNFRGELLTPSDAGYDTARRVWNGMVNKRPERASEAELTLVS